MREPTVRRSGRRTRQQRLLRTAVGLVAVVALIAIAGQLLGGDDGPPRREPPTPRVDFVASIRSESDAGRAPRAAAEAEGEEIRAFLNDWYQRAFVDPKRYGDGTFPEIAERFAQDARASFARDIASLTIGEAREEVERVDRPRGNADITVFFEKARTPRFAVARVSFRARATLKPDDSFPLEIRQSATLHLQNTARGWVVVYYTAKQRQDSVVPTPTATGTPS